jgi:large subunit ribosomal protein L30
MSAAGKKRTITIRMKKSKIGCKPKQRATLTGLGLRVIGRERTLENTPAVRRMIKSVIHLVEVVAETR